MNRLLFLTLGLCAAASGADWPQWRGPNRDGVSVEKIQTKWPLEGPPILWRANVATGFASIAVSQGRVYTMGNTNREDIISCLDALTGKSIWRHRYSARLDPQYYEGGPGATPTVFQGRVYTLNKWGSAFCVDALTGAVVWRHDLWQEGVRSNRWGFAGSPLIWKDTVILNAGTAGTALRLKDGAIAWSSGTNVAGYASPVIASLGGKTVLLIFASDFLAGLDPDTGREFWRHPFKTSWDTNNTDPLVHENTIFLSSFSRGCELIGITNDRPFRIYANKNLSNHLSPGIRLEDYLYAFSGEAKTRTDLRCLNLPTGEVKWTVTDPKFGSMLLAGQTLVILTEAGELILAEPSAKEFKALARAKVLSGVCWTPPALAQGLLYARNAAGELVCVDLRLSN